MKFRPLLLCLTLPLLHAHAQESPAATPPESAAEPVDPVGTMRQADLQAAFQALRGGFLQPGRLSDLELNRAALQGLLARLGDGAALVPAPAADKTSTPVKPHTELLAPGIGYLRPVAWQIGELPLLENSLGILTGQGATTLLLDLREPAAPAPLDVARGVLGLFLPPGTPLYSLTSGNAAPGPPVPSEGEPKWTQPVWILTDPDTGNAAELVAAVLMQAGRAFSVGTATAGLAVEFREVPAGPDYVLRFASAEAVLPDGTRLYHRPVAPLFPAPFEPEIKRRAFTASRTSGLKPWLFETERPRLNEHALMTGTNPELPWRVAHTAGEPTPFDTLPVIDRPLQQAVDLIRNAATLQLDVPPEVRKAK